MEKNLIDESKGTGFSMFQNFWIGFMFTFLWLLAGFSVIFLIPTHSNIMASRGRAANALLQSALYLLTPIFYMTLLCLLIMGVTIVRLSKNPDTGKKKIMFNKSSATWRKALMSILILAVIYLNIGILSAWVEAIIYYPGFLKP